jgi:hypothetical protein
MHWVAHRPSSFSTLAGVVGLSGYINAMFNELENRALLTGKRMDVVGHGFGFIKSMA